MVTMSEQNNGTPLRSGTLARLAGLSPDTLRHYERKGLLAPTRSDNGYREYGPEALKRVQLVQKALAVGFSLDELSRILQVRDHGGAPCRQVRALASAKLADLENRIRDMCALRDEMSALLAEWDARLAGTPRGERAWLLEGLLKSDGEHPVHGPISRTLGGRGRRRESRNE